MLEDLKKDIERLIACYEAQRECSASLEERVGQLSAENQALRKQITDLTSEIENLRLAAAFNLSDSAAKAYARTKIDKLIKEIDRCLAFVKKQELTDGTSANDDYPDE